MRPPILFLTAGFGVGLWCGLGPVPSGGAWYVVAPLLVAATLLHRRAPLGAAIGIMVVAGILWGTAAEREREATCAGTWSRERGAASSKAAIVSLEDPAPDSGGIVDAEVIPGACAGSVRLRWPEGTAARGGAPWVVAGGVGGPLLVRRGGVRLVAPPRRGRRACVRPRHTD